MADVQLHVEDHGTRFDMVITTGDQAAVQITAWDANGGQIAALQGQLPPEHLAVIARLFAAADTACGSPGPAPNLAQRRARHRNSHQPWTEADDEQLRNLVAGGADLQALMAQFGRSSEGIKRRLEKLGMDPKLPAATAAGQASTASDEQQAS